MPVRRKVDRRKAEALPAWSMTFLAGHDYFDELSTIGVATDEYGRPNRQEAEAAWHRLGALFLAEHAAEQARERHPIESEPWALEAFGVPGGRPARQSVGRY